MKKILSLIIGGVFVMTSSMVMADDVAKTSMDQNWMCTTNASSSDLDADKMADDNMAKMSKSASDAYAYAAMHCRDCTKITCETK